MAERLHRSSRVPNFTKPSDPEHLLPQHNRTALEERASQVGSVVGKVVVMLRRTQNTLKDVPNIPSNAANRINNLADAARMKAQDAANRISDLADAAKARTQELGEVAASRVDELRQAAVDKANELGSQVRTGYYRARLRANAVVRDYPLHVVLAVGAAGFLLGLGLRIWRASREY